MNDDPGMLLVGSGIIFMGLIWLAVKFAGSHGMNLNYADRIAIVTNLDHLPSGYQVVKGNDMSNARAVWVSHDGASDDARVLVFLMEKGDPSSNRIRKYLSIQNDANCQPAREYHKMINRRFILVVNTICHSEGTETYEQQATFRLSSQHAIVIDENAEKSVYDRDAFRTVVTTVANATAGTEMKL
jgi:hypothetical protein